MPCTELKPSDFDLLDQLNIRDWSRVVFSSVDPDAPRRLVDARMIELRSTVKVADGYYLMARLLPDGLSALADWEGLK
jgi:hypothetical protein